MVLYDKVNLNWFASNLLVSDAMKIVDNKTGKIIAFQQRYFSFGTLVEHILEVPFKGDYVCEDISLVATTFPKMDLNIGYVLVNFDRKLENNPKGVKK